MVDNTYIYGLYDLSDKDKTIRYIGKSDNPEKRLKRQIEKNNPVDILNEASSNFDKKNM